MKNTGDFNTGSYNSGNSNTGRHNKGNYNSGDGNAGDFNTGNYNPGDFNTGGFNTGEGNTGEFNIGDLNTGNENVGCLNTGDFNTGNYNTGSWNISNNNTGCFNTIEPKMMFFNKLSDITYEEWIFSKSYRLLKDMPTYISWIYPKEMTDEEKKSHPSYKITNGYYKQLTQAELYTKRQEWYNELSEEDKEAILSIPNFDSKIFEKCTGIKVK